jgi:hypothetical protein
MHGPATCNRVAAPRRGLLILLLMNPPPVLVRLPTYAALPSCPRPRVLFDELDEDGSGELDWSEYKAALQRLSIRLPVNKMREVFESVRAHTHIHISSPLVPRTRDVCCLACARVL